tara:strand:- start:47047 stop:48063 length:1017 start_codon:yes stop_codon:yes gene_type:complete
VEVCNPLDENKLRISQRREALEEQMIALSDRVIGQVSRFLVGRTCNRVEDLKHTDGWSNVINADSYETSGPLEVLEHSGGIMNDVCFDPGLLGVEEVASGAVRSLMTRGANCDYRSSLACFYFAQQWEIEGLKIRLVEPSDRFTDTHVLLELSADGVCVYCDPWLGKTFVGETAGVEVAKGVLDAWVAYKKHVKASDTTLRQFTWYHLSRFLNNWEDTHLEFHGKSSYPNIDQKKFVGWVKCLISEMEQDLSKDIKFQLVQYSNSRDFFLTKNNREDLLKVTELGRLFELRELYPSNPHIDSRMNQLLTWYINRVEQDDIPEDAVESLKADFREALGL